MENSTDNQNASDFAFLPLDEDIQESQRNYNMPIYGIKGSFALSPNVSVPYFSALLDLKRVTTELKTHEETAPSMDNVFMLAELFQREINETRVQHEIVDGFLRAPDKIKFFNSLTIVLLPKDDTGKILENFVSHDNESLRFEEDKFDQSFGGPKISQSLFGGVQLSVTPAANIARLRWDTKRIDAVAVDGQHRLKALKLWMQSRNNELTEIEKPTRISVLILLLHPNAGFNTTSHSTSIKSISREIFTDLNKNAKEVDLATQIILDDRNLESCCVRSIVTPRTAQMSDQLLPLSLLRWREANNRFDNSWYLNSLVNLHLIVDDAIGLQLPNEPMNVSKVRNYIRDLETALGKVDAAGNRSLSVEGVSLMVHYNQSYFDLTEAEGADTPVAPFSAIPGLYLKEAVEGFKTNYSPWLLKILRGFKPYQEIINYAQANGIVEGEFAKYLAQPQSAKLQLMKELEHKYQENWYDIVIGRHERAIASIKAYRDAGLGEQWAFKTIFQKAMVRLGKQIELGLSSNEKILIGAGIDDMLEFFNKLYDANLLRVYSSVDGMSHGIWTGIAVNPGNRKIRVSAQTEARIESMLRLWYFGYRYIKVNGIAGIDSARSTFSALAPKGAQASWLSSNDIRDLLDLFEREAEVLDPLKLPEAIEGEKRKEIERKIARNRLIEIAGSGWNVALSDTPPQSSPAENIAEDSMI